MKGFSKTRVPNLRRNDATGIFYAATRAGKHEVFRSLQTDLESIARLRLPLKLAEIRAAGGRWRGANLTLADCAAVFLQRKEGLGHQGKLLKPRSKDYLAENIAAWGRLIPGFGEVRAAAMKSAQLKEWADRARRRYAWTRFNGMLQVLRSILAVAVEAGALTTNPAQELIRARKPPGEPYVPSQVEFSQILWELDAVPSRKWARLNVRGLAFTGLRPNESKHLEAADIDLAGRTLRARVTKNGEPRLVYLSNQAVEFFEEEGIGPVLKAFKKSPRRALHTIERKLKLGTLTPYFGRHLNLTRMVEYGVDVRSVAAQAGHKDRGRTLLAHYAKAREEHMRETIRDFAV